MAPDGSGADFPFLPMEMPPIFQTNTRLYWRGARWDADG